MNRLLTTLALVLAGGALTTPPARAENPTHMGDLRVEDKASAFTPEGIKKAEDAFRRTQFRAPTELTVVTFKKVPESKHAAYEAAKNDKSAKKRFFDEWVREAARGTHGIFALVSMEGGHVSAIDDRQTDSRRGFGDEKLDTLSRKLYDGFRAASAIKDPTEAKRARDAGLLSAVNYVVDELKNTSVPNAEPRNRGHAAGNDHRAGGIGGTSIMSWICVGLVVLLGVWLVIGLIRAFTGGGHGGGGYGPGGGGYGGGGGGGGFFPSLLGGLFGAAAGMYLYDSFMGGHHAASAGDAMGAGGYDNGPVDTGAGDYDTGGAGGADLGDEGGGDFGGGDFGDAGGDVGGGGDFGGGDFGGGGGDFGGGGGDFGGGDW